jgi:replicative DNA helicase
VSVGLFHADFSLPSTTSKESDIIKYINSFLNDLSNELKTAKKLPSVVSPKAYFSYIQLSKQILQAKEDINSRLMTYDNVEKCFPNLDITTANLINRVRQERISSVDAFRIELETILLIIKTYNEIKASRKILLKLDEVKSNSIKQNTPVLNFLKEYDEIIAEANNNRSNFTVLDNQDHITDYLIFNNPQSVDTVINHIKSFFSTKYTVFKTGYELLDSQLNGIESSSVTIVTGPSNHAKSLFVLNLIRNMIILNKEQLTEKDMFLFVTLEDDINKLLRRILSVFGNNTARIIQRLFVKSSEVFREGSDSTVRELENILSAVITESIISVTNKTCTFLVKHCNENTFSVGDLRKLVDKHRLEGYNIKCIAVDYLDCMIDSSNGSKSSNYNDYDAQGQIVQDLRLAARVYTVPVLTITQNSKLSENFMQAMGNGLIGDSYKKVRFSDTVIMVRQREDLDLMCDIVKKDVMKNETTSVLSAAIPDLYYKDIIPFEIAITKAKEGSRSPSKFHLFSRTNLRVYGEFEKLQADLIEIETTSSNLLQKIEIAGFGNDISPMFEEDPLSEMSLI